MEEDTWQSDIKKRGPKPPPVLKMVPDLLGEGGFLPGVQTVEGELVAPTDLDILRPVFLLGQEQQSALGDAQVVGRVLEADQLGAVKSGIGIRHSISSREVSHSKGYSIFYPCQAYGLTPSSVDVSLGWGQSQQEVNMILGKLNCTQAVAVSESGEVVIMEMASPWETVPMDSSPPDEEPMNVFPIITRHSIELRYPGLRLVKGA